jgi:hypothetical protein
MPGLAEPAPTCAYPQGSPTTPARSPARGSNWPRCGASSAPAVGLLSARGPACVPGPVGAPLSRRGHAGALPHGGPAHCRRRRPPGRRPLAAASRVWCRRRGRRCPGHPGSCRRHVLPRSPGVRRTGDHPAGSSASREDGAPQTGAINTATSTARAMICSVRLMGPSPTQSKQGPVEQLECSPPCQGGGRGFKSRQDRFGQVAQSVRASA